MPAFSLSEHRFVSFDETPIYYRLTAPASGIHANLLIIHGAGEHSKRYDEFACFLAENGFSVYALDLRGYGKSGGSRAYVRSFDDFGHDIKALFQLIGKHNGQPRFLLGHSLGGLITTHAATTCLARENISGVLLSSPCYQLAFKVPAPIKWSAELLARLCPQFQYRTDTIPQKLTHDQVKIDQYLKDPLIYHKISSNLYVLMMRTMSTYLHMAQQMAYPVFIGQASDDWVVDKTASVAFFDALLIQDKTFRMYEGFFHEILYETHRQRVFDDMLNWLNHHAD
jgi:lysophospholipase